jgi:Peptidase family M48
MIVVRDTLQGPAATVARIRPYGLFFLATIYLRGETANLLYGGLIIGRHRLRSRQRFWPLLWIYGALPRGGACGPRPRPATRDRVVAVCGARDDLSRRRGRGDDARGGLPLVYAESRHSRAEETEADGAALEGLQRHGKDPRHFARILAVLERQQGTGRPEMRYFSSHPATQERIERFERARAKP